MKSAGKARNNGLYRHIRTSKEIIRNLLNDFFNNLHCLINRALNLWRNIKIVNFFPQRSKSAITILFINLFPEVIIGTEKLH